MHLEAHASPPLVEFGPVLEEVVEHLTVVLASVWEDALVEVVLPNFQLSLAFGLSPRLFCHRGRGSWVFCLIHAVARVLHRGPVFVPPLVDAFAPRLPSFLAHFLIALLVGLVAQPPFIEDDVHGTTLLLLWQLAAFDVAIDVPEESGQFLVVQL